MATITSSEPAGARPARLQPRSHVPSPEPPASPDEIPTVRRFSSAIALVALVQHAGRTDALITAASDLLAGFPWDSAGLTPAERQRRIAHLTELVTMAKRSSHLTIQVGRRISDELARCKE